jgi:hypothetical protein
MAKLRAKQKKMIQKWINDNPDTVNAFSDLADMPNYWECYEVWPHEDFDGNVSRYLSDNAPNPHMRDW